jgi:hypothetical protein
MIISIIIHNVRKVFFLNFVELIEAHITRNDEDCMLIQCKIWQVLGLMYPCCVTSWGTTTASATTYTVLDDLCTIDGLDQVPIWEHCYDPD